MSQFKDLGHTVSGMLHKLKMIQTIANNISNANTIGYQREIPESISFKSVLSETAMRDPSQGQIRKTERMFDLAIEGNAYFLIETKNGLQTTRSGKFHLDEKGELATMDGHEVVVVEKTDRPISLAKSHDIRINPSGEIFVGQDRYGRIALQIQDNRPVKVIQGFLEGSNVNLMNEMISLSMMFRAFESNEKIISMESSVEKELIDKYGRNV